ncbi:CLUMA_CG005573, isoform A [Clunio marinus]|uniref:Ubiquitin conjugation factor E4 A n=1 Tax=Clunio marinus TaxID=568069 RepID=A0A1J1I0T3_9DIPT|nr:CLUMA_CG005573, isoform A [Clunio marinus]
MSENPFDTLTSPQKINEIIENVLLITLNPDHTNKQLFLMEQSETRLWTVELIELNLFERIMALSFERGDDNKIVIYLYNSFLRLKHENKKGKSDVCDVLSSLIFRNVAVSLKEPELFPEQNICEQFLEIYKDSEIEDPSYRDEFLSSVIKKALEDSDNDMKSNVKEIFFKCFDECMKSIRQSSMITFEKWIMPFLIAFSSDKNNPEMANIFLNYTTPPPGCDGIKYADSLLGQILCLSMTPKNNQGPYEFYDNLQNTNLTSLNNLSASLWNYLKVLHDSLHSLIKGFLVIGGDTKERMLIWLGNAITSNVKRGQIWNTHTSMVLGNFTTAPDSFMIGLAGVLLRLCLPLMKPQLKVLIVDPTFSAVKAEQAAEKQVHMKDIDKETCLIPFEDDEERITATKYNFVTELFFMTQKAIDLSFRVCIEKVIRMNREIQRMQNAYQDAAQGGSNSDIAENIMNALTKQTQQLLCLQNLILEPRNDELLVLFYEATAMWVNLLATKTSINPEDAAKGYAPLTVNEIHLPLVNESSKLLQYIPEMILENIVGYLQFSKIFETQARQNHEAKENFITMILIFMGNSKRAKNPHLRANLAEGLESLLPKESNGYTMDTQLFHQHPHRLQIVENLLNVFVSIEMTGQSVQFEQKFNYRRPMYVIMEFLWKIPEQRECFNALSLDAEIHIDDVEAPIFLRFINVLINDSIFLLDESLSNLQQIRELEEARDNGKWDSLPNNERQQNAQNLQMLGNLARFDNILGRDTINILKLLTSETKGIFCHASMVDRIAAMLNYFLLHLCGPKQKNFKVKNKENFDFDPANTVKQICHLYLNLRESESFCLAVTQDGRSYSPELFKYAEKTLIKIGGGDLITEIIEFSDKVQKIEQRQRENDEALVNPPDEFLDPILSILMKDPVILPSSKVTVDRSTISRHLLSDQSDPFNRSPLSMDQVIPDTELKKKIEYWIKERLQNYNETKN